jgi:hypothetical protein
LNKFFEFRIFNVFVRHKINFSKFEIENQFDIHFLSREEIDKKFFGGGYNVSFKEEDKK